MDYLQLVTDKELDFAPLYKRMDVDQDLFYLKPFELTDEFGRAIPNVHNVTRNDPRVLANHMQSIFTGADMQIEVEGKGLKKIEDKKTTIVESFLWDIFGDMDKRIQKIWTRIPNLRAFLAQQICIRGGIASRYIGRMENKVFIPDLLPTDMRFLPYESGADGLKWAAYKTMRSKASIESEYKIIISGKATEVVSFYDDEFERIYIDKKLSREQRHKVGYVPFVIQLCPVGSMLMDDNALEHSGESIFDSLRDLYTPFNEAASIIHTTTHYGLNPPLQYESEAGEQGSVEKPPYGEGAVVSVEVGRGFKPMPLVDIHNAARNDYAMLERMIQTGGVSEVNFGALNQQLSAVAISKLTDTNKQKYDPRLLALSLFYENLAEMIIDQFITKGKSAELGRKGQRRTYNVADLKGDYSISISFHHISPEQNIANYSLAAAAGDMVSKDTKLRDIVQVKNPDAEAAKVWAELAPKLSLTLAKIYAIKGLITQGKEFEAELMATEMGITLKQVMGGQMPEEKPMPEQKPVQPIVPLMGGGRPGKTSAKEASELEIQLGTER